MIQGEFGGDLKGMLIRAARSVGNASLERELDVGIAPEVLAHIESSLGSRGTPGRRETCAAPVANDPVYRG